MYKQMWRVACYLLVLFMNIASAKEPVGLGAVAQNMMAPVGLVSNFVFSGCIIIGASFVFASIIKYFEYRRSPLMVPLGSVIFLLLAGIFLLILPFTYLLTQAGTPFFLMKQT